jgi:hypothetical protein
VLAHGGAAAATTTEFSTATAATKPAATAVELPAATAVGATAAASATKPATTAVGATAASATAVARNHRDASLVSERRRRRALRDCKCLPTYGKA